MRTISERIAYRKVPARFQPYLLGSKPLKLDTLAMKAVLEAQEKRSVLCALSGVAGCGKSLAAAWALCHEGLPCGIWAHAPDIGRAPIDEEREERRAREWLDRRMREVTLLVIDDVGIEHSPSGYGVARICDVLVHRELAMDRTIVTTNLTAEQFKQRYGERIASRLNGDTVGWRNVNGPDLRQQTPHWTERD